MYKVTKYCHTYSLFFLAVIVSAICSVFPGLFSIPSFAGQVFMHKNHIPKLYKFILWFARTNLCKRGKNKEVIIFLSFRVFPTRSTAMDCRVATFLLPLSNINVDNFIALKQRFRSRLKYVHEHRLSSFLCECHWCSESDLKQFYV